MNNGTDQGYSSDGCDTISKNWNEPISTKASTIHSSRQPMNDNGKRQIRRNLTDSPYKKNGVPIPYKNTAYVHVSSAKRPKIIGTAARGKSEGKEKSLL